MIYLPACVVVIGLILFQCITARPPKLEFAFVTNSYGERYQLLPIVCIGGDCADINILDTEDIDGDVPNIAEIRYDNEDYIIKNMDESCELTIKRGVRYLSVKPEKEVVLRHMDSIVVSYRDASITYEFSRG